MARSSWNCPPIWAPASTPCNPTAAFGQGPSGSLKTLTRTWRPAQALGARAAPYHGAPWGSLGALQSTPGPVEGGLLLLIFFYSSASLCLPVSALCDRGWWMSQPETRHLLPSCSARAEGGEGRKRSPAPCPGTTTERQSAGEALLLPESPASWHQSEPRRCSNISGRDSNQYEM